MNLHIVPDNTFVNKFCDNLEELNLTHHNKIIVRSNEKSLKFIRYNLPFAPLYSSQFSSFVGDTDQYDKVFIHYFTPLLYRWVASHKFRELNWMVWGGDLYNIPALDHLCYEPLTLEKYVKKDWSAQTLLYQSKVLITQALFRKKAYSKVKNILTWMNEEYQFALAHLPIHAEQKFFFYENQLPYEKLEAQEKSTARGNSLRLIVGNSGYPTNNHMDVVQFLEDHHVQADLIIPVSYGDPRYISFLKKNVRFTHGKIEFIERYMPFEEYLNLILNAEALVMNTIRPQGYGNILIMMYMNKAVFFNSKNISLPDLTNHGINWQPLEDLTLFSKPKNNLTVENKKAVVNLLSHDKLRISYRNLFS